MTLGTVDMVSASSQQYGKTKRNPLLDCWDWTCHLVFGAYAHGAGAYACYGTRNARRNPPLFQHCI